MFEGDSADTGAGKLPLVSMGGRAEGLACADPGARTPIGASGNFSVVVYTSIIIDQLLTCTHVASPLLACLSSQAGNLTAKDVILLNFHTPESWELPAVWLIATCLNFIWEDRLARKVSSLDRIRAELLARVSLLRSTKWKHYTLHNSALLLDEAINLHFI